MPSVARAGSPETEMVNLTPVALLKRSSSFRKSSAAWLHSPPVILNRLSIKIWEISQLPAYRPNRKPRRAS